MANVQGNPNPNMPIPITTVYHPETGKAYTGESVDCKELMSLHGYLRNPPEVKADEPAAKSDESTKSDAAPAKSKK